MRVCAYDNNKSTYFQVQQKFDLVIHMKKTRVFALFLFYFGGIRITLSIQRKLQIAKAKSAPF